MSRRVFIHQILLSAYCVPSYSSIFLDVGSLLLASVFHFLRKQGHQLRVMMRKRVLEQREGMKQLSVGVREAMDQGNAV